MSIGPKIIITTVLLGIILLLTGILAISAGSSGTHFGETLSILAGNIEPDSATATIIWQIRLPRVILAAFVGGTLALGGLVFQALLRNPLAEPYILGISGGSAIGAILAMLIGLSYFPGVAIFSFAGSLLVLAFVTTLAGTTLGNTMLSRDSLLLGGVMMNAFCAAIIMFLISMTRSFQVQHILYWLMGDLASLQKDQLSILFLVIPCFVVIFILARPMNLLLLGRETAAAMGINVKNTVLLLLVVTSLMVSIIVSLSGLVGFVGLVIPHIFRMSVGRSFIPYCLRPAGQGPSLIRGTACWHYHCHDRCPTFHYIAHEEQGMNHILDIDNILLIYRDKAILSKVSLSVSAGEFFVIIGPNGAGKTSLLKILSGLQKAQHGSVNIKGKSISQYSRRNLSKILAIVPQHIEVGFPFTVAETVIMGRTPHLSILGMEDKSDFQIAEEAMKFTEVSHLAKRKLFQLSGGELQRVIIARAICQQPEIILLDEPTTALDPAHQLKIMDLMERFRSQHNTTIIMVSHDLNLASMYGDRLLLLKEGRVIKTGDPKTVLNKSLLEESYGCQMMVDENPLGQVARVTPIPHKYQDI